ncbi:O-antigen ligase [Sphingomonas sp. BK580]|uniref:O-antigen ligase family protein n=1 Tax=Sphingomonas sp. BK580 TaxID=2586972 RepID=UPI00161E8E43|nr:O-antigen ligase family protein [Sphingomonas sp. BK580]MBB3693771.1 O-antigen ligase [Sphingomonas sp. BK580]
MDPVLQCRVRLPPPSVPWIRIVALFASLPVIAALLFRTYSWGVAPRWFEVVRQLDLLYGAVELGVIAVARNYGFSYADVYHRLPRDARCALIIFLSTFWISSVVGSDMVAYSIARAALWPLHLLFGAALWYLGGRSDAGAVRWLLRTLLLGYAAYAPILAWHFLAAPAPSAVPGGEIIWTSALPGYLSVRHFGIEMGAMLAMAMGTLWRDPRALGRPWIGFATIALVGGAACWSGTRAAVFGAGGALILTVTVRRCPPRASAAALIAVALLVGGALAQTLVPPSDSFGFRLAPSDVASAGFSSGRVELWRAALRLFLQRPLTGWGEGSSLWLIVSDGVSFAHPHDIAVQMLESWGAPAALAAFYLVARLWLELRRRGEAHGWLLPLLMATDALLIMSFVDGVYFHARLLMLVGVLHAIGLAATAAPIRESSLRERRRSPGGDIAVSLS